MTRLLTLIEQNLTSDEKSLFVKDLEKQVWHTRKEVRESVAALQGIFKENQLETGDSIIIAVPNSYRFVLLFLAALESGLTITSMNPQIPADELQKNLSKRDYQAMILEGERCDLLENNPDYTIKKQIAGIPEDVLLVKEKAHRNSQRVLREDSLAIQMFTSGTTGEPKIVGISHKQLLAAVNNICLSHALSKTDITYICLPLFHINAQVISLLSTVASQGKLVIGKKFSARNFWNIIAEEQITWVSAAPAILTILLKRHEEGTGISHQLRFIRSASAPLAVSVAQKFEEIFAVPVIESYGMTEGASQICINPLPPAKHVFGSVGMPVGVELKIFDEANQVLPAGEIGEIVIRGESVITHYIDRNNCDDFYDGWFLTGDMGYVNEEGYIFIVGRKKEVINRGGEKISPYEVEDVLLQLDDISSAAVVGLADAIVGQQVAAFIVLKPEASRFEAQVRDKINQHCQEHLSKFKRPEQIFFVKELPVGPTGKVQRKKIIAQVEGEMVHA